MRRSALLLAFPLLVSFVGCSKDEQSLPVGAGTADPLGAHAVVEVGQCVNDCAAEASSEGDAGKERCRESCRKECRRDCARDGVSSSFQDTCHADCDRQIDALEP